MPAGSSRDERQFGFVVGGAILLLGAWLALRGPRSLGAAAGLAAGAALVLLGLLAPRALVLPRRWWMAFAEAIAFLVTRLILAVVFFFIVTPVGVARRLLGSDPLRRRGGPRDTHWLPYSDRQRDPRHYEKMY